MTSTPITDSTANLGTGWRWAPAFVLAFVALFPAPGYAEGVLVLGSLAALIHLLLTRFRGGARLLSGPAWALTTVLFLAYWLPALFSSFDSVTGAKAVQTSLLSLLYLPFLWLVASAVATARNRRVTVNGLALIVGIWALDALIQAVSGTSPIFAGIDGLKVLIDGHPMCTADEIAALDRLSGFMGPCNLKLGPVLATFAPFLLWVAAQRMGVKGWLVAAVAVGLVVLLSGSRGAWVTYALVLALSGWKVVGYRGLLAMALVGVVSLAAGYVAVPQVQQRVDRTLSAASMNDDGVDNALSGRGRIWSAAGCMIQQHPINGVGTRGFRHAFAACDPEPGSTVEWGDGPALHAHQLVLEVLAETGVIGLLFWIVGAVTAWRAWKYAPASARQRAQPATWALMATVFPLNTSLAFYSAFWGSVTLLLSALFVGLLLAHDDHESA